VINETPDASDGAAGQIIFRQRGISLVVRLAESFPFASAQGFGSPAALRSA
jgi:hypothetical protein